MTTPSSRTRRSLAMVVVAGLFIACTQQPPHNAVASDTGGVSSQPSVTPQSPLRPLVVADSILRIPLRSGDTIDLVSNPNVEAATVHQYDRHWNLVPFHGVKVQYYEAIGYFLIHDSTGRQTRIDAAPLPSPSGRSMVVASLDLNFIIAPNAISILQISGDSTVEEWRHDPRDWGPNEPIWVGEDTIRFTRVWAREQRKAVPESPAMIVRRGRGWEIQGIVPDSLPEDTTEVH